MDVAVGDRIVFRKANEIIPEITSVLERCKHRNTCQPTVCPSCGSTVAEDANGTHLVCLNKACPAQFKELVLHMLRKLDIQGIAESTIDKIVEEGLIKYPWEMFRLTAGDLTKIGFGQRQSVIIVEALSNVKAKASQVCACLGIEMWGERMFELLMAASGGLYDEKRILAGDFVYGELVAIHGVGASKARMICEAMKDTHNLDFLKELQKSVRVEIPMKNTGGGLAGKTFLLTGTLSKERKLVEADIVAAGGSIKSGVSASLSFLVVGENAGSKLDKAQKLGVKVLSEEELYEMISK